MKKDKNIIKDRAGNSLEITKKGGLKFTLILKKGDPLYKKLTKKMKISIIHPSRGRPDSAYKTAFNWLSNSDTEIEYILSIDKNDNQNFKYNDLFLRYELCTKGAIIVISNNNHSAIEAINSAVKTATGDLFVVISDDFDCPEHWDTLLLNALEGKEDFIVKTQDGIQKTLITLPIMDRKYYERFGYIYHPDYLHMFADEEMTIVGLMLGRVINLDLKFEHLHYSTGKSPKDAINVKNDDTWAYGQATIDRRAVNNFGIENPLVKIKEIIWH